MLYSMVSTEQMRSQLLTVHSNDTAWHRRVKHMTSETVTNVWRRMKTLGKLDDICEKEEKRNENDDH